MSKYNVGDLVAVDKSKIDKYYRFIDPEGYAIGYVEKVNRRGHYGAYITYLVILQVSEESSLRFTCDHVEVIDRELIPLSELSL